MRRRPTAVEDGASHWTVRLGLGAEPMECTLEVLIVLRIRGLVTAAADALAGSA
jgi:hypothetical protein